MLHYVVTPPQYRAAAILQIEQRNVLSVNNERNPWLDAWATLKYYPTQYRLLQSRGLAERVVVDLRLAEDPTFNPAAAAAGEAAGEPGEATIAGLANRLLAGLKIDPVDDTELVAVSFTSQHPELAAKVVNGLASTFIDWGIEDRSLAVGKASRFLAAQVETLKREIQEKETQLHDYSRTTDIVGIDPSSNVTLQKLERLNGEATAALGDRLEKEARYLELQSALREAVADRESGGLIGEMSRELSLLETNYGTLLQTYKPDWPKMIELNAQIEEGRVRLAKAIDENFEKARRAAYSEFQTAMRRERSLESQIEKAKTEAMDLGQASVEYNNLQMEISTRRELQDELLKQLSEAGMSARLSGTRESNIRVIDRALVPAAPFRPSLRNDAMVGLAGGLALGAGLVLLFHFLDRTVKSSEELERLLGLPVLAVVPDIDQSGQGYGYRSYLSYGYGRGKAGPRGRRERGSSREAVDIELVPEVQPRLAVSEAYRSFRTALLLSSAEELKVVIITSAEAGEGKTATAANLGVVMAQLGRRVLLIDADLRKPRQHQVLAVSNRVGLVNYFTGSAQPEEICLPTGIQNLSICPSGPHPPNPSELLASDRMKDFLRIARERYDFVIVDTPPVLAVTDAILPASIGDGVVLCFRANTVHREDVLACRNRLRLAEVKILGAVLNRYRPTRSTPYDRRYNYYETYTTAADQAASDSAA